MAFPEKFTIDVDSLDRGEVGRLLEKLGYRAAGHDGWKGLDYRYWQRAFSYDTKITHSDSRDWYDGDDAKESQLKIVTIEDLRRAVGEESPEPLTELRNVWFKVPSGAWKEVGK